MNGSIPWYYMYGQNTCPCRYCTERHATCHGECEKYKTWQQVRPKVEHVIADIGEKNRQRRKKNNGN